MSKSMDYQVWRLIEDLGSCYNWGIVSFRNHNCVYFKSVMRFKSMDKLMIWPDGIDYVILGFPVAVVICVGM